MESVYVFLKRSDSIAKEKKKSAHLQVQLDGIHSGASTLCVYIAMSAGDALVSGYGKCILLSTLFLFLHLVQW